MTSNRAQSLVYRTAILQRGQSWHVWKHCSPQISPRVYMPFFAPIEVPRQSNIQLTGRREVKSFGRGSSVWCACHSKWLSTGMGASDDHSLLQFPCWVHGLHRRTGGICVFGLPSIVDLVILCPAGNETEGSRSG